ncbi:MAG: peptidoglycan-associated lipoprotein Pal [Pseudomonadales bacterium]
MTKQWIRNLLLISMVAVVAGCASGGKSKPTEPSVEPVETSDTTPAPGGLSTEPAGFDNNLNPYAPGTTRLLPRTYYFEFDQAVLGPDDLTSLAMHAQVLLNNRDRSVVIEGHCDERGTREYNLALGERRANAIRTYLTSAGVSPRQVESVSYGEERPEDPGHAEAAYARNRRAVLIYR